MLSCRGAAHGARERPRGSWHMWFGGEYIYMSYSNDLYIESSALHPPVLSPLLLSHAAPMHR